MCRIAVRFDIYEQVLISESQEELTYYGIVFQSGTERLDFPALTQDKAALERLAQSILTQDVDFMHIPDIMEDFAAELVTVP